MSLITHLTCVQCGAKYKEGEADTCPRCGMDEGILDVHFDLTPRKQTISRDDLKGRTRSHWRYRELLPLESEFCPKKGYVGWTPIVNAPRLAEALGIKRLRLKDEGRNPSGSFKDRPSSVGVARAMQTGAKAIACASTGNAASSCARAAAMAGRPCYIFVAKFVPQGKLAQLLAYGATVFRVQGTYAQAYDLCNQACAKFGWYNRNAAINPYLVEGKKTGGMELAEQLADDPPQWVSASESAMDAPIAGMHKGIESMKAVGLINWSAKMLGVQAAGCDPVTRAFETGKLDRSGGGDTYADSINVAIPRNWRKAVNAVRESNGAYVSVTDDQIMKSVPLTGRLTGVFAEPAGATAVAGIAVARERGIIGPDADVLAMITGNGLKDIAGALKAVGDPHDVDPSIDAVSRVVEKSLMGIVLTNALLVDLDPIAVERGSLRIDGNTIAARGFAPSQPGDEVFDCGGAVVLPGLVNGHTHLYSALAVGMPAPPRTPTNFIEILRYVWWRLDQALDAESNEMSATIGALQALHCGTTTLIDHHASPRGIEHSLDSIERGIDSVGLRGVLCYETTDRHGKKGREAGLEENRRYLGKCALAKNGKFAALAGAHASFTLEDESLKALSGWAEEFAVGVHIHVAEDPADEAACRKEHGVSLIDRLEKFDLLGPQHIFAHGTHLDADAIARMNEAGLSLAHNARSNMNNAVGYSPIGKLKCPVQLGTDGIGADMFAEAQTACFKSRDGGAGISPADVIAMLANSARRASQSLKVTLGKLQVGAAADVVITDYIPFSDLTAANLPGHFIFAIGSRNVRHVIANGRWALRDRIVQTCDEPAVHARSIATASALWKRMESIPC